MRRGRLYLWGVLCIVLTVFIQVDVWSNIDGPGVVGICMRFIDIPSIAFILLFQGIFLCIIRKFKRVMKILLHPEIIETGDIQIIKGLQGIAYVVAVIIAAVNVYKCLDAYTSDLQFYIAWSVVPILYASIIYLFWLPLGFVAKSDGDKKNLG